MQCCYGGENVQLVLKIVESWKEKLGILFFLCVFNPLLQIAWASGVLGTLFTKRKWSHHFKLAAADMTSAW